jgi:hypothetical protein
LLSFFYLFSISNLGYSIMENYRHHHHGHVENSYSIDIPASAAQVKHAERRARTRPSFRRIILRIISLAVGASVLAVLAHATYVWFATRNGVLMLANGVTMPSWPAEMDLKPTWIMLATAAFAVLVQILALLTLVGKVGRFKFNASNG